MNNTATDPTEAKLIIPINPKTPPADSSPRETVSPQSPLNTTSPGLPIQQHLITQVQQQPNRNQDQNQNQNHSRNVDPSSLITQVSPPTGIFLL